MLVASHGFHDAFPLLVVMRARDGREPKLWLCDGACRVDAAASHVAAAPDCGEQWRAAFVLYLRADLPQEAVVRARAQALRRTSCRRTRATFLDGGRLHAEHHRAPNNAPVPARPPSLRASLLVEAVPSGSSFAAR